MRRIDVIACGLALIGGSAAAQLVSVELAYPPGELIAGVEGVVGFEVGLGKKGEVLRCEVTRSSGSANLDRETCRQLRKTGRFKPGLDRSGRAIPSTYASKLRWSIPGQVAATVPPVPPR